MVAVHIMVKGQEAVILISYVDDGTIIVQSKTIELNLAKLKSAYSSVHQLTRAVDLGYAPSSQGPPLSFPNVSGDTWVFSLTTDSHLESMWQCTPGKRLLLHLPWHP